MYNRDLFALDIVMSKKKKKKYFRIFLKVCFYSPTIKKITMKYQTHLSYRETNQH